MRINDKRSSGEECKAGASAAPFERAAVKAIAVEQKDQLIAPQPAEGGTGSVAREGFGGGAHKCPILASDARHSVLANIWNGSDMR